LCGGGGGGGGGGEGFIKGTVNGGQIDAAAAVHESINLPKRRSASQSNPISID
jgi:hypothetical protein